MMGGTLQLVEKFLQLVGTIVLVGPAMFYFMLVGSSRRTKAGDGELRVRRSFADDVLNKVRWIAATGAVAVWMSAFLQSRRMAGPLVEGLPLFDQMYEGILFLLNSFGGRFILARAGLAGAFLVLFILAVRTKKINSKREGAGWVARLALAMLGVAMTVTIAYNGHAAGSLVQAFTVASQSLHLASVVLWAGGLFTLALLPWSALRKRARRHMEDVERGLSIVSGLGLTAVVTVVVTGFLLTAFYVFSFQAAADSMYGRMLGIKLVTFGLIVATAATHRVYLMPRLERADGSLSRLFAQIGTVVRLEAVLLTAVIVLSAVVTQTPPPSTPGALPPQQWGDEVGPFAVEVDIVSEAPTEIRLDVYVEDNVTGKPVELERLNVDLGMPGHVMGVPPRTAEPAAPGLFTTEAVVAMLGHWEAAFEAIYDGETYFFVAPFVVSRAEGTPPSRLQQLLSGGFLSAAPLVLSLAVAAVGFILFASGAGGRRPVGQPLFLGSFLMITGIMWTFMYSGITPPGVQIVVTDGGADGQSLPSTGGAPEGSRPGSGEGYTGLTMAATVDEYLVELVVEPARPGLNNLQISVQDYFGDAVDGARVSVGVDLPASDKSREGYFEATPGDDGYTFHAEVELDGNDLWDVAVQVESNFGQPRQATFEVPIPVTGAKEILRLADEAMNRLQSIRIREEMRGRPGGVMTTEFTHLAPDRAHFVTSMGMEQIIVGETRYMRQGEEGEWRAGRWPQQNGYKWPDFNYAKESYDEVLLRVDRYNDRDTFVVTFLAPPGIRYTFWIDTETYIVHYLEMLTTGHYMYWWLSDFDEPVVIEPPISDG